MVRLKLSLLLVLFGANLAACFVMPGPPLPWPTGDAGDQPEALMAADAGADAPEDAP